MAISWGVEVQKAYLYIEISGLKEVQQKMTQVVEDLYGPPILNAMRDATLKVQRDAMINAPVDTGRLRASIVPEVRATTKEIEGVVGSNVEYAPYMEFGTGMHTERAMMGVGGRHFPPPKALDLWAKRHGIPSGFLVARAIFRAGGLKPRRFLRNAFEKNEDYIRGLFDRAIEVIVERK